MSEPSPGPETVVIRRATAGDAPVLLELIDALADYEKLERPTPDARERLVRDGFGESPRFVAYLAETAGGAVGYAITFLTYSSFLARPTLFLEDIFVLPEARRAGAGSAFFRHLAVEALRQGCGRMEWMVLDWNRLAIDFYEKVGARRLSGWLPYRLTVPELERLAEAR
jgi:GNAT superfamily N-acetyltransferase